MKTRIKKEKENEEKTCKSVCIFIKFFWHQLNQQAKFVGASVSLEVPLLFQLFIKTKTNLIGNHVKCGYECLHFIWIHRYAFQFLNDFHTSFKSENRNFEEIYPRK